jgi:hypothetical protein
MVTHNLTWKTTEVLPHPVRRLARNLPNRATGNAQTLSQPFLFKQKVIVGYQDLHGGIHCCMAAARPKTCFIVPCLYTSRAN